LTSTPSFSAACPRHRHHGLHLRGAKEQRNARTTLLSDAIRIESSADDRASAALLADAIAAPSDHGFSLLLDDGTAVPLSPGLVSILRASIGELGDGHAVTILPSETELTPAEVAELLGLSRPFVVRLLAIGASSFPTYSPSNHAATSDAPGGNG
jgi:hypothetical protein